LEVSFNASRVLHAFGQRAHVAARERGVERAIHAPTREGVGRVIQRLRQRRDARRRRRARGLGRRAQLREALLDGLALTGIQQIGVGRERLLGRVNDAAALHAGLRQATLLEVFLAVVERIDEHLLDLLVREAVTRLHLHALLYARRQLSSAHLEQRVFIDVEAHLQASLACGQRRDALQGEARERTTVLGELALALHDVQLEARLVVCVCGERRLGAHGYRRVARQDPIDRAAHRLDTEAQR
jgi:hypothetical protein